MANPTSDVAAGGSSRWQGIARRVPAIAARWRISSLAPGTSGRWLRSIACDRHATGRAPWDDLIADHLGAGDTFLGQQPSRRVVDCWASHRSSHGTSVSRCERIPLWIFRRSWFHRCDWRRWRALGPLRGHRPFDGVHATPGKSIRSSPYHLVPLEIGHCHRVAPLLADQQKCKRQNHQSQQDCIAALQSPSHRTSHRSSTPGPDGSRSYRLQVSCGCGKRGHPAGWRGCRLLHRRDDRTARFG